MGPESRRAWLIDRAVEAPLQFPKNRKMIFELGEALFASENRTFKNCEFSAASRIFLAILHLREERHYGPSRPRNPDSKSFGFTLCLCDRRTHRSRTER
jgi:hypothetical protein